MRHQRESLTSRLREVLSEVQRLQQENVNIIAENQQLTEENERLEQSANDLRAQSAELSRIKKAIGEFVERINKDEG